MRIAARLLVTLCLSLLLAVTLLVPGHVRAAEGKSEKKAEKKTEKKAEKKENKEAKGGEAAPASILAAPPPPLDKLWETAQDLLQLGDTAGAARAFYLVHFHYPEDAKGEPALWLAANLEKELAQVAKDPDWEKVQDRFRRYIDYYPKGPRAAEAYFELGKSYQAMHYYRESQAYFKLFMERYPDSPLVVQAMRGYRNTILRAGHGDEAEKVFRAWRQSTNTNIRLMGEMGEGTLKSAQGDYKEALAIYQKILAAAPDYAVADPEILRYAGIANLRLDKGEAGREQLYHYLTLTGVSAERTDVLFELAESYFKAENFQGALKLYRQVVTEGGGNERTVLLSNLRMAQCLDDPEIKLAKWQRHNDLSEPAGDKAYLAVLEQLYRDPVAQDARFGIFKRYQARGELDKAYEVGRNFLRNTEPAAADSPQSKKIGRILLYLVEELLKAKRYREICDLYNSEYRHIKDFPSGKLLAMVGQAFEAMDLYEPAASLYYLAGKWPLADQEKTDLYFRRARAYLAIRDYESAERLLTYLHKTYQGKPEAGEIAYFSAKLSADRGQIDAAREWYDKALNHPTFPEKRPEIANEALGLMVKEATYGQAETLLAKAVASEWLPAEAEQGWWLKIGSGWRQQGDLAKAQAAYDHGLGQGMPDTGDTAQEIHLYLGDVLCGQGDKERCLSHYQAASQGDNPLWKRMAAERLTQHELDAEMAAMKKGSSK